VGDTYRLLLTFVPGTCPGAEMWVGAGGHLLLHSSSAGACAMSKSCGLSIGAIHNEHFSQSSRGASVDDCCHADQSCELSIERDHNFDLHDSNRK
jgi:hypothetical protein